jgi:hypothetical protein
VEIYRVIKQSRKSEVIFEMVKVIYNHSYALSDTANSFDVNFIQFLSATKRQPVHFKMFRELMKTARDGYPGYDISSSDSDTETGEGDDCRVNDGSVISDDSDYNSDSDYSVLVENSWY